MLTGKRIKERRIALGLSADQLGDMVGKNRATIYRYESSDIENFPLSVITLLASALNTSAAFLMGWTDDPSNPADAAKKSLKTPLNALYSVSKLLSEKNQKRLLEYANMLLTVQRSGHDFD